MLDWHTIDTVLLDMDGTLLDLHYDNHFWMEYLPQRYADIHGHTVSDAKQHLHQRIAAEHGSLNWYCLDYWSEQLQLDIPALKREIDHMITIRPYVIDFLTQLQQSGKQLLLVSNAHRQSLNIKLDRTGIGRFFSNIVVSHDYRAAKEDPAFWHHLHAHHPFDRHRTLLIDDNESVLDSAHRYGIQHLLTLLQPDSHQPVRVRTSFPVIHHFDELLPGLQEGK